MPLFADLHIHSRYSRAVSESMDLEHVSAGARLKGLGLMGTGDFTHPAWFKELKEKLVEKNDTGLYALREEENAPNPVLFMLTAEVSTIISTPKGVKKVHHVVHAPSLDAVAQLNDVYAKMGDLSVDGRPTLGRCSPAHFAEATFQACRDAVIVPAHAWTPWFAVFGSMSGYNSLEEAYEDQAPRIFAIETGMSSDPAMNWRISALDRVALLSNSDAHSPHPWRLGRECNVFELKRTSYGELFDAVKKKDPRRFVYTIEVDPGYGKYHFDGHRNCGFSSPPGETRKINGICPVCRRPLTIGVLNRVEQLADRPEGFAPPGATPFKTILPLHELLAAVFGVQLASKKVMEEGEKLTRAFGSELNLLLNVPRDSLSGETDDKIKDVILLNREGKVKVKPGYDGEYGVPEIGGNAVQGREKRASVQAPRGQKSLGEFG
ncbi:MAG: endonuclease Q family protein [Candidatus Micrarchaeota archaeon]|nr:endonuclease Q family protein [Candidatus Micrarchaeota archaeon]